MEQHLSAEFSIVPSDQTFSKNFVAAGVVVAVLVPLVSAVVIKLFSDFHTRSDTLFVQDCLEKLSA